MASRPPALTAVEPNIYYRPKSRTLLSRSKKPATTTATTTAAKRRLAAAPSALSAPVAPSPLKKQSDYELVAPLAPKAPRTTTTAAPPAAAASAAAVAAAAAAAAAAGGRGPAPVTPKPKRDRRKHLCATPPSVLHDSRGGREYGRGKQLGEGGFARCFLVKNQEGERFAAKTVSKLSLENAKMKAKACFPLRACFG